MAETKYSFSKECDGPRLTQEIQNSSIVTALDRIEGASSLCDVWFKDALSSTDEIVLLSLIDSHINMALPDNEIKTVALDSPKDAAGRIIMRGAATIDGWHYQLLSTEVITAKLNGFYSKEEDGNDIGFVTHKIYDVNGVEITTQQDEGNAVKTSIWIRPTHAYEVIGAIFGQNSVPTSNIYLFSTGLPGIANVKFSLGGINLKHAGQGTYQLTDGRASKYLAHVPGMPDANSFKFTMRHDAGVQHTFQISLEIFKAP